MSTKRLTSSRRSGSYLKIPVGPETADAFNDAAGVWTPPPDLTVSEWADRFRVLSREDSAEPGRFRTSRAEYQRGILDAYNDPTVERIVWVACAQVGKTQSALNLLGYIIDQDPGPVLIVYPTVEAAEGWSKERLAPMLRDTPVFAGKVADPRSRDSGNTILHKNFPGGHLSAVGANAPTGLASRPIRVVLADEIDKFPLSAGLEGDPVSLAEKRTATFWNRKIVLISTPSVMGVSRVWGSYEDSDQRRFWVPCPDCGEFQTLVWAQVHWEQNRPETAHYVCAHCGSVWDDAARWRAVAQGHWRAGAAFTGTAGFHISGLYSPWVELGAAAKEFLEKKGDPERLKTFVNAVLGEPFQEKGDAPEWRRLYDRREDYPIGIVPAGGLFLTAGVDVQADRLEISVWAWGRGKQSWLIEHRVIPGRPQETGVLDRLTAFLGESWEHVSGVAMPLQRLAVDSGYATTDIYAWARKCGDRRVMVVKGTDRAATVVGQPNRVDLTVNGRKMRRGVAVWPVGVNIVKHETYGWLRLDRPTVESGEPWPAGYIHLPQVDEEFLKQLTAEEVVTKTVKGFKRLEWMKTRERNEALDCRVYARAAAALSGLDQMQDTHWAALEAQVKAAPRKETKLAPPAPGGTGTRAGGDAPPKGDPPPRDPAPPPAPRSSGPRPGGWLGKRGRNWLK